MHWALVLPSLCCPPSFVPDPQLTCPCCSNHFGLASGTIPLGGVGSNSNGVGGLWGEATDGGFLKEKGEGQVPSHPVRRV